MEVDGGPRKGARAVGQRLQQSMYMRKNGWSFSNRAAISFDLQKHYKPPAFECLTGHQQEHWQWLLLLDISPRQQPPCIFNHDCKKSSCHRSNWRASCIYPRSRVSNTLQLDISFWVVRKGLESSVTKNNKTSDETVVVNGVLASSWTKLRELDRKCWKLCFGVEAPYLDIFHHSLLLALYSIQRRFNFL